MWPLHLETKCRFFVCNESPVDWSYHGVPRLKKVSKAKIKYKKRFCFGVHRKIDETVIIHINSTAIKVSIPHKEMSLCCFLSISGSKNVIWASFDVLVSRGVKSIPISELRNYVVIKLIRTATKKICWNPFRNRIFLFLSYSFTNVHTLL